MGEENTLHFSCQIESVTFEHLRTSMVYLKRGIFYAMDSYTKRVTRRILIVTGIMILPWLIMLGFGIVEYRKWPTKGADPDPELGITIPLTLIFLTSVVTCATGSLIAMTHQSLTQKNYKGAALAILIGLFGYLLLVYGLF